MTLKNIMEKLKIVSSSGSRLFQEGLSYLTSCYPMVRAIGDCLSQRFFKNIFGTRGEMTVETKHAEMLRRKMIDSPKII